MTVKLSANKKYFGIKNYSFLQIPLGEEREAFQLAGLQQQDAGAAGQRDVGHHQPQDRGYR